MKTKYYITHFIKKINEDIEGLTLLLNDFIEENFNEESEYHKEAFLNSILSLVYSKDFAPLSAKEAVTCETLRNINDYKIAMEIAKDICFGETTMDEAIIWKENFSDSYSRDDPIDVENYKKLLKH